MRRIYPILLALSLFVVTVSPAQIGTSQRPIGGNRAQSGASGGIWIVLAPHILVSFTQLAPNTCTWTFRNSDNFRILESMRFSYTYSNTPLSRGPVSGVGSKTNEDTLSESLGPQQEAGGPSLYSIAANCMTVKMKVQNAQWI